MTAKAKTKSRKKRAQDDERTLAEDAISDKRRTESGSAVDSGTLQRRGCAPIGKKTKKKLDRYVLWIGGSTAGVVLGFAIMIFIPHANYHLVNDESFIAMINSKKAGWTAAAIPQFVGMSITDVKNMGGITASSSQICPRLNVDVPRHFDVRDKWPLCFSSPVYEQGNCSSSWAIQAASVLANRFCIGADDPGEFLAFMLSPQQLLSCSSRNKGCKGGDLDKAFEFIRRNGLVTELCFPYQGDDTVACRSKCTQKSWTSSSQCVVDSATSLKQEVFLNGPVVVPMFLFDDFLVYKKGVYRPLPTAAQLMGSPRKGQFLLHAVKLLGWGEENGEEYWLIENSFGAQWGTNGVGKVRRGERKVNLPPGVPSRDQVIVEFGISVTPSHGKHTYGEGNMD